MIITEFEKEMIDMFNKLSKENKKKVFNALLEMVNTAKERQVV